jgi:hypothetical protein
VRQTTNLRTKVTDSGGCVQSSMMTDVSVTGARLSPIDGLRSGQAVSIDFGEGRVAATVAWEDGHAAGVSFREPRKELPLGAVTSQAA